MIRQSYVALMLTSLVLTSASVQAGGLQIDLSGLSGSVAKQPASNDKLQGSAGPDNGLTKSTGIVGGKQGSARYQQTETVSSTVYSSQQLDSGMRRNIELVKPKADSFNLSPVKVSSAITPAVKAKPINIEPAPSVEPAVAVEQDKSMLSFIDEWLGIEPVKPWQKGTLAKPEMKPGGVVPEFDRFSEKVFSYKQGSVGGNGVGGGGCGCN